MSTTRTRKISPPPKHPYSFGALLTIGRRVNPSPEECSGRRILPVRSFQSLPITSIKLSDVLEGKHTTPFTLREFEDFLVYSEHSAENLYFAVFYHDYIKAFCKLYGKSEKEQPCPVDLPSHLATPFQQALQLFIMRGAPLELNMTAQVRDAVLLDSKHSADPSVLRPAASAAQNALEESLSSFVASNLGNAGGRRGWFAIILGVLLVIAGIALIPVACVLGWHRAWRVLCLPLFFLGTLIGVAGWRQTCLVIWLLGGKARQLHSWEVERQRSLSQGQTAEQAVRPSLGSQHSSESITKSLASSSLTSSPSAASCPWMDEDALSTTFSRPLRNSGLAFYPTPNSDFSFFKKILPKSPAVWSGLTKVDSPEVLQHQWRSIFTGCCYGTFVMVCLGALALAVPARRI